MEKQSVTLDTTSWDTLKSQVDAIYGTASGYIVCYRLGSVTFTYGEELIRRDVADLSDGYNAITNLLYNLKHCGVAWPEVR